MLDVLPNRPAFRWTAIVAFPRALALAVALAVATSSSLMSQEAQTAADPDIETDHLGLMVMPLTNGFSRMIEKDADRFSIESTNNPQGFISMMNKLAQLNLAELEPNKFIEFFFYDHPTMKKRIQFAQHYLK